MTHHFYAFDYAVVIGRFQPVHNGHVAMLHAALQTAARLIVVVGSVNQPRSLKNPFSFEERQHLLLAALPKAMQQRIHIVAVPDYNDDVAWVAAVHDVVAGSISQHQQQPKQQKIALVGHEKDSSSYYLKLFSNWHFHAIDNIDDINATHIRTSYFAQPQPSQPHLPAWQDTALLPVSTLEFLQQFMQTDAYNALITQHRAV